MVRTTEYLTSYYSSLYKLNNLALIFMISIFIRNPLNLYFVLKYYFINLSRKTFKKSFLLTNAFL